MQFTTNGSEKARIDSSGRLGIGRTPTTNLLEVADTIKLTNLTAGEGFIGFNTNGVKLGITASDSVGAGMKFEVGLSERARIDGSGNFMVGGTNSRPAEFNHPKGISFRGDIGQIQASTDANIPLLLNRDTSDGTIVDFRKDGTTVGSIGAGSDELIIGTADTGLRFYDFGDAIIPRSTSNGTRDGTTDLGTSSNRFKNLYLSGGVYANNASGAFLWNAENAHIVFGTNNTERMRINAAGQIAISNTSTINANLHIGSASATGDTTNPALQIGGATTYRMGLYTSTEGAVIENKNGDDGIQFRVKTVGEAMRIDGGTGDVYVGKTAANISTDGIELGIRIESTADGTYPLRLNRRNSDGEIVNFRKDGATVGTISVTSSATAYNTSSDARLKDITGEAKGLEVINKLNPVAYNWKEDGKADEGLIAQEVQEIVPNAVSQNQEEYYQMDYSKLVVHLVKGMQEQQAQIEELKKEIQNLKG